MRESFIMCNINNSNEKEFKQVYISNKFKLYGEDLTKQMTKTTACNRNDDSAI